VGASVGTVVVDSVGTRVGAVSTVAALVGVGIKFGRVVAFGSARVGTGGIQGTSADGLRVAVGRAVGALGGVAVETA
jgi:hypothetical protein